MHIIAIATSFACSLYVLFAFCVQEISDRRELSLNLFSVQKPTIGILLSILCILLFTVFDINIANNVISQIINNNHILDFTILHHLFENIFIKILAFGHSGIRICSTHIVSINKSSLHSIVLIHVLQTDSLTNWRFVMNSLTAVTVPAGPHFIEKRAIHLIHFGTIDFGEPVSHL